MTPEIVTRVDAWLITNASSGPLARRWASLSDWWWTLRRRCLECEANANAAAMLGVLLALVREAWGEHGMLHERCDGIWIVRRPRGPAGLIEGPHGSAFFTEDEALATALETAPRREPSA